MSGNQAGSTLSFTIFCDLDYTQTSLDGQLNTSGTVETAGSTSVWNSDLTFNDVTYAGGQPTGGSIDVSASVMLGGVTYAANSTATF